MAKHGDVATGPGWTLFCGPWQDVLADVECDALITDPPYSARTHKGHDAGATLARGGHAPRSDGTMDRRRPRRAISYVAADCALINAVAGFPCRGWRAVMSDSVLTNDWRDAFERVGLTGFQPVPCVIRGMTVRLSGDGPSSWAVYLNAGRPKRLCKWGTLPGAYMSGQGERFHVGGKPLSLMQAIVRDYSRPGDLVCDPYAGGGTTLLAAVIEGRRAIGAELDPVTFEKAVARLREGYTPDMFARQEQARVQLVPGELPF